MKSIVHTIFRHRYHKIPTRVRETYQSCTFLSTRWQSRNSVSFEWVLSLKTKTNKKPKVSGQGISSLLPFYPTSLCGTIGTKLLTITEISRPDQETFCNLLHYASGVGVGGGIYFLKLLICSIISKNISKICKCFRKDLALKKNTTWQRQQGGMLS